ncbi:MAG TPA: FHA domain-containing protein [Myxococcota bacterium]|nr:FHA domain-containing protein [Myxococcota bacterium]
MAHVRVDVSGARTVTLRHGDLIGRMPTAALCLDDPRISEAHALLSLRGTGFELLALRRPLQVEGRPVTSAAARVGARVGLVPGVTLTVVDVTLPDRVPALRTSDGAVHVLHGVASILPGSPSTVAPGYEARAACTVWLVGDALRVAIGDAPARPLSVGERLGDVEVVDVPLRDAASAGTEAAPLVPRLRIEARYDLVRLVQDGSMPVDLHGRSARIISELVALGGQAEWSLLAGEIWGDDVDRLVLRERWDAALRRLRTQLREAGLRDDLVSPDGLGNLVLRVHPWDEVVDQA